MGLIIVLWLVSGLIGSAIGSSKGRPGAGFVLGILLGFIGWIIVACMSKTPQKLAEEHVQVAAAIASANGGSAQLRKCPWCAEQIQREAVVCRYCGRDVPAAPKIEPFPVEGWYPDPLSRHPDRWFDGKAWTQWVRDQPGGTRTEDPI